MHNEDLLQQRHSDGCTALHIAAIVGNTNAADLLVTRNKKLLLVKDKDNKDPLHKAYEYMHLDTIGYLLKAVNDDGKTEPKSSPNGSVDHPDSDTDMAVELLVNAISAKQYSLASDLVQTFPGFASGYDDVLMALAKNFPSGLDYWETLVYPSFIELLVSLIFTMLGNLVLLGFPAAVLLTTIIDRPPIKNTIGTLVFKTVIVTVPAMLISAFGFIWLLAIIVCLPFFLIYYLLWKGLNILACKSLEQIYFLPILF